MATSIALPPEPERLIAKALRSGTFQNPEDVIQRGLELLHHRDASLAENRRCPKEYLFLDIDMLTRA
jgi:Arc/MetJ-type ribon-helix-helix transcriptional regulator